MAVGINLRSVFPFWVAMCLVISPLLFLPLVSGAHFYDNQRLIEISCVLFALVAIWTQLIHASAIPQLLSRPLTLLLTLFFCWVWFPVARPIRRAMHFLSGQTCSCCLA